jgi:hypothetical protein
MKLIYIILALSCSSLTLRSETGSTLLEKGQWDSIKFGLYAEHRAPEDNWKQLAPIFSLSKSKQGNYLFCINGGNISSKILSKAEFESVIKKLQYFYKDISSETKHPDLEGSTHHMILVFDFGLSHREYTKIVSTKNDGISKEYFSYLWELSDHQQAEQGAAANP